VRILTALLCERLIDIRDEVIERDAAIRDRARAVAGQVDRISADTILQRLQLYPAAERPMQQKQVLHAFEA
jgi:hypothetical protein